jgi:oligopeptide/dipeptide ABC transporter ATP-binding protein
MTQTGAAILEGIGLSKHFAGRRGWRGLRSVVRAVDEVSIAVRRGETLALVGESGSGKSTLGRVLLNLIAPTQGDVLYDGRNIGKLPAGQLRTLRRELQIIFQDPFSSLNPRMTVEGIVGEPIWLHEAIPAEERRDKVASLLRTVGLRPEQASRYPHEFSGGQRQRIGIARALASSPKVLLADEPVSALDVSVQAQIVNLLEELKTRFSLTLVIVAHGLAIIRHMSDRVAVMYLGQIVEIAPVGALFETPLHPYTQALLASVPTPSPRARRDRALIHGDVPSGFAPPPGCRFHTRCPHVRPLCREARPPLETATEGRGVACHFWREIAASGAGAILAPPPSPALTRRLALFEARMQHTEAVQIQETA